jgi:hypothetical protein
MRFLLVNKDTGTDMWVHASRLEEYLAAGHRLAAPPERPLPPEPVKRPPARRKSSSK